MAEMVIRKLGDIETVSWDDSDAKLVILEAVNDQGRWGAYLVEIVRDGQVMEIIDRYGKVWRR